MWNSGCLDYNELPNILPKDLKADYFAEETEKCKILGNLKVKNKRFLVKGGKLG